MLWGPRVTHSCLCVCFQFFKAFSRTGSGATLPGGCPGSWGIWELPTLSPPSLTWAASRVKKAHQGRRGEAFPGESQVCVSPDLSSAASLDDAFGKMRLKKRLHLAPSWEAGRVTCSRNNPLCLSGVGIQRGSWTAWGSPGGPEGLSPTLREGSPCSASGHRGGPSPHPLGSVVLRTSSCPGTFVREAEGGTGIRSPHMPPCVRLHLQWLVPMCRRCGKGSLMPSRPTVTRGPPPAPRWSPPGIWG